MEFCYRVRGSKLITCGFLWLAFCFVSVAQTVTVKVLNGNNGRPLPKQGVSVQFFYDSPRHVTPPVRMKTDSEGTIRFTLPSPAPQHLDVRALLTSEYWNCRCRVMEDTGTVLQKGILATLAGQKLKPSIKAAPKQITFAPAPFSLIERILYPLVKD